MNKELGNRVLGRWDSVAISIGIVIGAGIFRVPSEVVPHIASPVWILIAWSLGGLYSFLGSLCYAELATRFPDTGGDYVFLRECYGKLTAFLFAWSELLITRTGSVAAIALMFGEFAIKFLPYHAKTGEWEVKTLAVSVIMALSACNLLGLKTGSRLQNALTILKILAISFVIIVGLFAMKAPANNLDFAHFMSKETLSTFSLFNLGVALVPIMWAYGGWRDNLFLAGETKEPTSSLPFALFLSCIAVTVIYVLMNFLYLWFLPLEQIRHAKLVGTDLLSVICGQAGEASSRLLGIFIMVYALGTVNALLLTGSRIASAMSLDNPLFASLGKLDEKRQTPVRGILFNGLWSCLLVFALSFERLLYFTGFSVWIFFAMVAASIIKLRYQKSDTTNNRESDKFYTPLFPLIPAVVAIVALFLALSTLMDYKIESLCGMAIIFCGVPLFFFQKKN